VGALSSRSLLSSSSLHSVIIIKHVTLSCALGIPCRPGPGPSDAQQLWRDATQTYLYLIQTSVWPFQLIIHHVLLSLLSLRATHHSFSWQHLNFLYCCSSTACTSNSGSTKLSTFCSTVPRYLQEVTQLHRLDRFTHSWSPASVLSITLSHSLPSPITPSILHIPCSGLAYPFLSTCPCASHTLPGIPYTHHVISGFFHIAHGISVVLERWRPNQSGCKQSVPWQTYL
jgi:hypothetical protein